MNPIVYTIARLEYENMCESAQRLHHTGEHRSGERLLRRLWKPISALAGLLAATRMRIGAESARSVRRLGKQLA